MQEIATGLRFPEGPTLLPDGSMLVVEIERGTLTRIAPTGSREIVADLGGGPNGLAIGPDGAAYVCNNGGFAWHDDAGLLRPGMQPDDYSGGRIERVDLTTGEVRTLFTAHEHGPLRGPNDIVFDATGGFYFSDIGKSRARDMDRGAVFYARPDGSSIREVIQPSVTPNGVGLSPDGGTLYVAETQTGRLWAYELSAPGVIRGGNPWPFNLGRLVAGLPGFQLFDSLAVEAGGNICVATLISGGVTVISPEGEIVEFVSMPDDPYVTNLCFGGPDMTTAFVTLSGTGRVVACPWKRPGLRLNFG